MDLIWSELSKKQLALIGQYVSEQFGSRVAEKSVSKIVSKVEVLRKYPSIGSIDLRFSTREYVVRHINLYPNVVYFLVYNEKIIVIAVMHTKQSPRTVSTIIRRFLQNYQG